MALRLSELVLETRAPEELARFWCAALDYVILDREDDGSVEIGPASGFGGAQPTIVLSQCADPTPHQGRLHFDVNAMESTQEDEVERLRALGATDLDVGQSGDEGWVVLQDPEGNAFCVLRAVLEP
ncbi:VOC family protein [Arthrobacter rhombi]|uniref:VOC family protein n=1 Tax=Arthrobacter rhombi TaxID=71253 RepID=UPI0031D32A89